MDEKIGIKGVPSRGDPFRCSFVVDRPVYEGRSFYFGSKEKAAGSPLAEKLFAMPEIDSVLISHDTLTVTVSRPVAWPDLGKQIGAAIRESLAASGRPAVDPSLAATLPPAEVIREVVDHLIDTRVNPALAAHGGFVRLLDVRDNAVYLEMGGGCQGCGMADVTLRGGIETMIRELVPEVGEILDVTDHASGRNPYYSPATK